MFIYDHLRGNSMQHEAAGELQRGRGFFVVALALSAAAAGAVLGLRPWADSVMTVEITVATDDRPPVVVYRGSKVLREAATKLPVLNVDLDLSPWAGELVRLSVDGEMSPRLHKDASGIVACAAELTSAEGTRAIEFVGWRQRPEWDFHPGAIGTQACGLGTGEEVDFAFATEGHLWHVLRVPSEAGLRVAAKPVPSTRLPCAPEPCEPRRPLRGWVWLPLAGQQRERLPDIFIYLVDSLRADHLGCYGYARDTSPAIDAFASQSVLYENAQTVATWTRPSVATLFTGLYPSVHQTVSVLDAMPEWVVSLPEILVDAGYHTIGVATNPNITRELGLGQGFNELTYRDSTTAWVNQVAKRSLAATRADQRVFMYLHTMEPHGPYTPRADSLCLFDRGIEGRCDGTRAALRRWPVLRPDLSDTDFAHLIDLYDAEIFEADQGFAHFLDLLRRTDRYDNSLIVFLSDHGEAFGEHNTRSHAWTLNQEEMHVALIVRYPGGTHGGLRVEQRVSLIDVLPTVLSAVGLRAQLPYRLPGIDLARLAHPEQAGPERPVYAEVSKWAGNDLNLVGVIDEDGYKRVVDVSVSPQDNATQQSLGLWDTRADPKEEVDLSEKLPVRAAYGEQLIVRWLHGQLDWSGKGPAPEGPVVISEELERELRALGYLQPGSPSLNP